MIPPGSSPITPPLGESGDGGPERVEPLGPRSHNAGTTCPEQRQQVPRSRASGIRITGHIRAGRIWTERPKWYPGPIRLMDRKCYLAPPDPSSGHEGGNQNREAAPSWRAPREVSDDAAELIRI